MFVRAMSVIAACVLLGFVSVAAADEPLARDKPTVAFVTNGIANFWNIAKTGASRPARTSTAK